MTKATQESTAPSDERKQMEFATAELQDKLIDSIKRLDAVVTALVVLAGMTSVSANGMQTLRQLIIVLSGASTETNEISADLQNAVKVQR